MVQSLAQAHSISMTQIVHHIKKTLHAQWKHCSIQNQWLTNLDLLINSSGLWLQQLSQMLYSQRSSRGPHLWFFETFLTNGADMSGGYHKEGKLMCSKATAALRVNRHTTSLALQEALRFTISFSQALAYLILQVGLFTQICLELLWT